MVTNENSYGLTRRLKGIGKPYKSPYKYIDAHLDLSYPKLMEKRSDFEWDSAKDELNQKRHGDKEKRFYCVGRVFNGIMTVRFTYRNNKIRIIGAGYWRKGKKIYEKESKIR
jgi:uncharacterized protein